MAHAIYTDVTAAVRAYLNDQTVTGGATYDDTFLQPYVWLAQQTLVNYLISNTVRRLQFRTIMYINAGTKTLQYEDDPNNSPATGPQILTNGQLADSATGWALVGDFAVNAGAVTYTHGGGSGTLTQVSADLVMPGTGSVGYLFTYTISGVGGVAPAAEISNAFAAVAVPLTTNANGTYTVEFTSAVTPGDFSISATSGVAGTFTIDDMSLTPVSSSQKLLPANLIVPDQLWERQVGGIESDFVMMRGPGELPRISNTTTLGYWEWASGYVTFIGATQAREVRMDYWADLGALPIGTSQQGIINSGNSLALLTASYAARARGQGELAQQFAQFNSDGTIGGQAGWEIQQIISAEIKSQQSEPVRRQPYFGRDRYSNQTGWTRWRY